MKGLSLLVLCGIVLAGCNKSPEQKIQNAKEKQIDAKAEVAQEKAQGDADGVADAVKNVQDANKNMAETVAEVAKDKAEAQNEVAEQFRELSERVANVKAKPVPTDAGAAAEFSQTLSLIDANMADAQAKITELGNASPTEWQGPHQNAKNALAKLDESIDKIE